MQHRAWGVGLAIFVLGGASLGAASSTPPREASPPSTANLTLDRLVEERMGQAGMVGLAAAILVDGRVVWSAGYGFGDRESRRPFTTDTVMNVGSIAKTVVGVALLQAVEQGKLRLDDDVNLHVPFRVRNPRHEEVPITLRQLATHTSGITDREPVYTDSYHQGGDSPVALGDFLREYFVPVGRSWSADNFIDGKPGSQREYSNIGAGLAAYAVERATGRPFHESTRDAIFRPLGMSATGWFLSEIERANHATLYDARRGEAKPIPIYGLATWPDGGLRTSVNDLSRFFAALLGDGAHEGARILSPASVEELRRFQYTTATKPENVELDEKNSGIFWSTKRDTTLVGHSGSDPGVQAEMLAEPSRRVAVILLSNTTLARRGERAFLEIFDALLARGREIASLRP